MLESLKKQILDANLKLYKYGLAVLTWGNVSAIDRETGLVVIKPSGVSYETMKVSDMVVMSLDGKKVEGEFNPSSDTDTHLELYRNFDSIGGVVHTHSPWGVAFSQAGRDIKAYGTTHADFAFGDVPCARGLTKEEVEGDYELNTGKVIVDCFNKRNLNPNEIPGVLVQRHGPFTWGKDCFAAVENAVILEEVAKMAAYTEQVSHLKNIGIEDYLLNKHYTRKHGENAYYGQDNK